MLKVLHVLYTLLLGLFPVVVLAAMDAPIRHHRIITGNYPFAVILANPLAYCEIVGVGP